MQKLSKYLLCLQLTLHTDTEALKYSTNMCDLYGLLARWMSIFAEIGLEIKYGKGKKNLNSNYLKRHIRSTVISIPNKKEKRSLSTISCT